MFRAGEKIICTDASGRPDGFDYWVIKDKEYIVRRCEGTLDEGQRVLLVGLKNKSVYIPELGGKAEIGFSVRRFRRPSEMGEIAEEVVEEMEYQ